MSNNTILALYEQGLDVNPAYIPTEPPLGTGKKWGFFYYSNQDEDPQQVCTLPGDQILILDPLHGSMGHTDGPNHGKLVTVMALYYGVIPLIVERLVVPDTTEYDFRLRRRASHGVAPILEAPAIERAPLGYLYSALRPEDDRLFSPAP